jgi:PAS domain S-box-containing protein
LGDRPLLEDDHIAADAHAYPSGAGEMAERVRRHDWASTSLGPIDAWPQSLRTTVSLLIASPVPIVLLWGQDGVMIYNDAYSIFAGGRHPRLLGSNVREGWPEVADFNDNVMRVGLAGGTLAYKDQELTLHRTGRPEQVWMNLDYWPVADESGRPGGVIATVVETTERVLADRQRDLISQRLQMALSAGNGVGTWDWDIVADRVYADERFARIYGVDPALARDGTGIAEFFTRIHPDDLGPTQTLIAQAIATGDLFSTEYRLIQDDGTIRWVSAEGRVSFAKDGSPVRFPGVTLDVTERRETDQALRESQRRLQLALDAADLGAFVWHPQRDHSEADDRMMAMFGLPPEGDLTLTGAMERSIHPDDAANYLAAVQRALDPSGDGRFHYDVRVLMPDQTERLIRIIAKVQFAGGLPQTMTGTAQDVSEAQAREAALRELNETLERRVVERTEELTRAHEALRQSQKMEAVGQLTGGIAHDFNNLLAGISGALELLSKRLHEGRLNGMERYIAAAQGSTQRAASLTQRLLAFSRRQTLDPKLTDVNRLIQGMEDLIRRSVGPNVEMVVLGAADLWATKIDQSQLENALLNLCINARDAMAPDGGRLIIETANIWLNDQQSGTHDLSPGRYISVSVTDTGTGMPPEVQAQAFDPFFTTKPLGQGTGLGLSMVHGFVRQSGGEVRISSEVGKGTSMCLYLPGYSGAPDRDETVGATTISEGGHGETVLIIDDEETLRMLVAEVLSDAGYHVIDAPDGPTGLEILRSDRRIDLLVSDVGLPGGLNGRQVADAARVSRPDLKILFVTGYAETAALGNGLLAPGMGVLTKPFAMRQLNAKVRDMLDG